MDAKIRYLIFGKSHVGSLRVSGLLGGGRV